MSKRKKFIAISMILSLGFVILPFIPDTYKILSIAVLALLTFILFLWGLRESLSMDATVLALVLPVFFTSGVGLFWFLLPTSIISGILVITFYSVGIYALALTANIYTVAAIRTIALLRAARGVGFVLSLITSFLLYDTLLSLRENLIFVSVAAALLSFFIYAQAFWSVQLERVLSREVLQTSLVSAVIIGQVALVLYFWPVTVVVGSLFLTSATYVLIGLGQSHLEDRLFAQTVREYISLAIAVFLAMFLTTSWHG